MVFLPRFNFTPSMVRNLGTIESARAVIDILPLPPDRVLSLRQAARRRATRNSTGIEGNTLIGIEIDEAVVSVGKTHTQMQQEVRNYWRALEWIEQQQEARRPIGEEFICELHSIILVRGQGRRGTRSVYRETECPVVDSGTRRIDYGPPTPQDVPALMRELVAWWQSPAAAELTGPIRAGLLAHRFVSIHPFDDGNGRTARALATAELWRSSYDMRGFLSLEEHYASDLKAYYDNLQMGLPVNFYEGRHDPDHTPWLVYFVGTMARAAEDLHKNAIALYDPARRPVQPWERLHRVQQQLLSRLMLRGQEAVAATPTFVPSDVVEWFGVSAQTAREWLGKWRDDGFVQPAKGGVQRVRAYVLAPEWAGVLGEALDSVADKDG